MQRKDCRKPQQHKKRNAFFFYQGNKVAGSNRITCRRTKSKPFTGKDTPARANEQTAGPTKDTGRLRSCNTGHFQKPGFRGNLSSRIIRRMQPRTEARNTTGLPCSLLLLSLEQSFRQQSDHFTMGKDQSRFRKRTKIGISNRPGSQPRLNRSTNRMELLKARIIRQRRTPFLFSG